MSDKTQTDNEIVFPEDDFTISQKSSEETSTSSQPVEAPIEEHANEVADKQQESPVAPKQEAAIAPEDTTQAESVSNSVSFADFGFSDELLQGITEAGFTEPTPIQQKAMPEVLAGRDIIGQALTGSGKTAAFGLPIIDKIRHQDGLNFLVLVPTRELATQVSGELFRLGRYTGLKTAAFTGGQSYSRQESILNHGINALVATPGRLIDLINSGHFKDINPAHIVVDEADEMLDMGFIEDVRTIFATFPGPHQTMLFSATMPKPVIELAAEILHDPVNITTSIHESANNDIEQLFFVIEESERANAVIRLIDAEDVTKAMIFCRTKEETDALNILLSARGYNVNCLHGDMEQAQRSRVMSAFRRGEIDILVATDVAARGLDVDDVTHVFNYHLPFDSRGYVHRIGRTGRAGKTGTAITLVTPREMRQLDMIRKTVGAQIENRLVPTRTQVTEMRLKKIFRDLNEVQLDVNLLNQIQTLTTNQDLEVLIAKLVAHELANGGDTGPEHIGIGGQRLERLLAPKSRDKRRSGDRDGGFGRRRGSRFTDEDDRHSRFERRDRRSSERRGESFDQRDSFQRSEENYPREEQHAAFERDEHPATFEREEYPRKSNRDDRSEFTPRNREDRPEFTPRNRDDRPEFTPRRREHDDDRPRKFDREDRPEFTPRRREHDDDRPRKFDRDDRSEFTPRRREHDDDRPRKFDRDDRPEFTHRRRESEDRPEFTPRRREHDDDRPRKFDREDRPEFTPRRREHKSSEDYSNNGLKGKAAQKERRQFFKQLAEDKAPRKKYSDDFSPRAKFGSGHEDRKSGKGGKGKKDRFDKQDKPSRDVPPPPPSNWYFN